MGLDHQSWHLDQTEEQDGGGVSHAENEVQRRSGVAQVRSVSHHREMAELQGSAGI